MSRSLVRVASLLVLVALLTAPGSAVAGQRSEPAASLLIQLWEQVVAFWADTLDNGCSFDPHGGCGGGTTSTPETPDNGCSMDPHGGCGIRSETLDSGCGFDPYGGCGR